MSGQDFLARLTVKGQKTNSRDISKRGGAAVVGAYLLIMFVRGRM